MIPRKEKTPVRALGNKKSSGRAALALTTVSSPISLPLPSILCQPAAASSSLDSYAPDVRALLQEHNSLDDALYAWAKAVLPTAVAGSATVTLAVRMT